MAYNHRDEAMYFHLYVVPDLVNRKMAVGDKELYFVAALFPIVLKLLISVF